MDFTQRFIGIGVVFTLLIASSSAQIVVQPGYVHPSYGQQRYIGVPMQQSPVMYQQSSRSLDDEFQRNQALQSMVKNQILRMEQLQEQPTQQVQQTPEEMVALGLFPFPIRHRIGGGNLFSLGPTGLRGIRLRGYGFTRPLILRRESSDPYTQANYKDDSQGTESGESGTDFGKDPEFYDVASESSVEDENDYGVDDLPVPQASIANDFTDKLKNFRENHGSDAIIVGSPLDRIQYESPYDIDQHHPMDYQRIQSQFQKSAHAIDQMIGTVAQGQTNSLSGDENEDSRFSLTRHQDPAKNNEYSQYYQPSSYQAERSESPNNGNAPITSSINQPIAGQSYNSQRPQDSGWRSMASDQSRQTSRNEDSDNDQDSKQTPSIKSHANNWSSAARQMLKGPHRALNNPQSGYQKYQQPGYQRYQQPGYQKYQQPGYQNYQSGNQNYQIQPQTEGYRPNVNGQWPSYNYGSSRPNGSAYTSSGSANSAANDYNYYNPHIRRTYNNPYMGYNPYGISRAVDQFGRATWSQPLSAVNSITSDPSNKDYFTGMVVKRPYGY